MKLPPEVVGFDSASAMVVALARFLHGRDTPPLGRPAFRALRPVAAVAARLPAAVQESLYSAFSGAEGRAAPDVARLDLDAIAAGIARAYPRRRYPVVMIGSSGGALVHLAAALGAPWLPQTVLLPVRQRGVSPDDPQRAADALAGAGRALLDRNPELVLHHMHDPNQDRLTLRRMAYFRVKRRTLGPAYEKFLLDHLAPGGVILVTECGQRWPVTTMGDRHGFRVRRLAFDEPEALSPMVAELYRWWYERRGMPGNRLFVDSFMLLDPWWTLRAGAVPYWSVFPVRPSLDALRRYLDGAEPYDRIDIALFCHGVESAGIAGADRWRAIGSLSGVDPRRFPRDFRTFFAYQEALRRARPHPIPEPLSIDAFDDYRNSRRYRSISSA